MAGADERVECGHSGRYIETLHHTMVGNGLKYTRIRMDMAMSTTCENLAVNIVRL